MLDEDELLPQEKAEMAYHLIEREEKRQQEEQAAARRAARKIRSKPRK